MSLILGDDGKLLFPLLEPGHWAQEVPGKISKKLISKPKLNKSKIEWPIVLGVLVWLFLDKSINSQLILLAKQSPNL
jgi:hypothetical protein